MTDQKRQDEMLDGKSIPDVQRYADTRNIAINKVGIKDVRHPIRVKDRSSGAQHTVATFNMYVFLPKDFKGTHMSRFVQILNGHDYPIGIESFNDMLDEVSDKLEASEAHIEMKFPYFIEKKAPVTETRSLMDYEVTFLGDIQDGKKELTLRIVVPVTTLCPCSKKISERGAHNQRSHITVTVTPKDFIWMEEIIEMVEAQASSELWALLKRPDEKYVTERAYDNPKFVEDLARDVAATLAAETRLGRFVVEVENYESIHNHSAYALIESESL